jgi:elongator complex protein 3
MRDKHIEFLLRKAQIRTLSGVAIITSLTKPYACPGQCIYCPTETKMPKSYIASEPAAARALGLNFDPYEQMQRRIKMLEQNSHPTDKIEYIIKGGTWNSYPLKYQYWFILRSFEACNDLTHKNKRLKDCKIRRLNKKRNNLSIFQSYNLEQLHKKLNIEQEYNDKKARHKIIGLTLETRPDAITPTTIFHMRQQGCTRIELGLQAPDDKILELVKRGHTVQQFKDAMYLLRQAGFKVDLHFMPGLPGSTPEHDVEMYKQLFSDPGFKPDMVKIYPCTVIKNTELYQWLKDKKYKPYDEKELFDAIIQMKVNTPRYCRISRLIRDIPANEIEGGNIITNLRESLQTEMKIRGFACQCLRCREVGHASPLLSKERDRVRSLPKLFIDTYETIGGTEYFLSYEDQKRQTVFAFLRLRIPLLGKEGLGVVEKISNRFIASSYNIVQH